MEERKKKEEKEKERRKSQEERRGRKGFHRERGQDWESKGCGMSDTV